MPIANDLPAALIYSAAFVLGLVVGSFLNVVIIRQPRRMMYQWRQQCLEYLGIQGPAKEPPPPGIVVEPSHCVVCSHRLSAWENIPVISYLLLRGRCRGCGTRIAWRYPVVELITAVLSLVVVWHFGLSAAAIGALALTWSLIVLTGIDLEHQLLPDTITLPLLWLGLVFNLATTYAPLDQAVIGALAGYLSLWLVYQAFRLLTGKEGMGYGDFKLTAALGAWLGWSMLPVIILFASLSGALVGIALLLLARTERETPLPFGPYLAAGGWLALIWGDALLQRYFAAFNVV
ncbi:MAG: A24 family peptidase [Wenzhouxiangellaceae bacterium]